MYAIISDRGRQARVQQGDLITCDWNSAWQPGQAITFNEILLIGDESSARVGKPTVAGASVTAEVVDHVQGEKHVVFRFRRRKNIRRKRGHREDFTRVRITGILG